MYMYKVQTKSTDPAPKVHVEAWYSTVAKLGGSTGLHRLKHCQKQVFKWTALPEVAWELRNYT